MTAFDLTPPTATQTEALIAGLSSEERRVLLQHGTEAPFCGVFLDNKREGVYCCRLCALPLFRSSTKFDSGTGWPSFFAPFDPAHVREIRDTSHGMVRTEITCALRQPPGPRVPGWSAAHLRATLPELRLTFVHRQWRALARSVAAWRRRKRRGGLKHPADRFHRIPLQKTGRRADKEISSPCVAPCSSSLDSWSSSSA